MEEHTSFGVNNSARICERLQENELWKSPLSVKKGEVEEIA